MRNPDGPRSDDRSGMAETDKSVPAAAPEAPKKSRIGADLLPRVLSGVVMAAVAFGLTYAGPMPFAALLLFGGMVLAWEWGHMVRGANVDATMAAHVAAVVAAVVLVAMGQTGLALIALAIGLILVGLLAMGHHAVLSAVGVLFAGLPAIALIWLRNDGALGFTAVLFVMLAVIATDTAAYFSGRLIGGPKIWPRVSPNKTWAGLIGAVIGAALVGIVISQFVPGARPGRLAVIGALLAVVAQMGDFAESALKRHFGAKDASALIPGHGGLMDRVDGLVTAAIAAGLIAAASNVLAPARALLQ